MTKTVILIAFLILSILVIFLIMGVNQPKITQGQVLDCQNNQPIANANVTLSERNWGFSNGQLVWDKDYIYEGTSDSNGLFSINYNGSPAQVIAKKSGYLESWQTLGPKIMMLEGTDSAKITYGCTLSTDCYKTETINGVKTTTNICRN